MVLNLFFYLVIFLFGLAIGSFLNCIIYRLQTGKSFLKNHSFCPYCKNQLSWQDLIPILSFLFLKGKCRYCQQKISWQYPLVELATGILFTYIVYYNFPNFLITSFWLVITCFLIIIFVYDFKYYIIPDKIIYPAIGIAFLYQLFGIGDLKFLSQAFFSALATTSFFLVIVLISQGKWLGLGDVKLAFFIGIFLGFPNVLVALFSAFIIGAIIGLGLIFSFQKSLKSEIPFAPFLITGTLLALFFGEKLINWYLNFLKL